VGIISIYHQLSIIFILRTGAGNQAVEQFYLFQDVYISTLHDRQCRSKPFPSLPFKDCIDRSAARGLLISEELMPDADRVQQVACVKSVY
jgi:hypothetical protein